MEHGLILSRSSYFLWTGVWSIFCSSSGGGTSTCFCSRLHPRKLRWNLKIHRFCRFFRGVYSSSTVSFREYIPCHNPMRHHLQAPSGQNLQPGSKGMSGTPGPGGKGPGGKGPGMAMPAMPMPGGKGMPGMPHHKGNGCRGMNQQGMQGMQSMNPMGMQQGPSMAQQSLAMHHSVTIFCVWMGWKIDRHLKIEECEHKSVLTRRHFKSLWVSDLCLLATIYCFFQWDHLGSKRFFKKSVTLFPGQEKLLKSCMCFL